MPQRKYSTSREQVVYPSKRIVLPIEMEAYQQLVADPHAFRAWVDEMVEQYPELFPATIHEGYRLHDIRTSHKLPTLRLRRIKLRVAAVPAGGAVFTIAPSGVLPYMTGYTDEVEKALFLRRFGVPYWGLSYVFGRNDQYWYRLTAHFGRYDIVQTTVKEATALPLDLLADEKHVRFHGQTAYVATTVAADCVLGASLSLAADSVSLGTAYGVFAQEAQQLAPDYAPQTLNTDGWTPTQNAWRQLFASVVLIECFLHAFLKIRERCRRRFKAVFGEIQHQVWEIYRAPDAATLHERAQSFQQWAQQTVSGSALEAINKLCAKADRFVLAFEHPTAYRTSNMIDRHMEPLARWLFSSRYFHGHWAAAERQVRAWALFHNFGPYCPRARLEQPFTSPVHQLTGRVYHENWLHNLLVATSLAGVTAHHKIRQN